MGTIPFQYRETFVRLKKATQRLHTLIESGEFHSYGYLKRRKLLRRVRKLYNRLAGPVPPRLVTGLLAAASVLALAGCPNPAGTDGDGNGGGDDGDGDTNPPVSFAIGDAEALGLTYSYTAGFGWFFNTGPIAVADLDDDGDLDLHYVQNYVGDGSHSSVSRQSGDTGATFLPATQNPDGMDIYFYEEVSFPSDHNYSIVFPFTFADLDNDGDMDLIGGGDIYYYVDYTFDSHHEGIIVVPNEGTASVPSFGYPRALASDAGIPAADEAAFVDVDNDGDLDLLTAVQVASRTEPIIDVYLTVNTGSVSSFQAESTVSLSYGFSTITGYYVGGVGLADIDNDGDIDFLLTAMDTSSAPHVLFVENNSDTSSLSFSEPVSNPFGISFPDYGWVAGYSTQQLGLGVGDFDNDGDIDLVVGAYWNSIDDTYNSAFVFLENELVP